MFTEQLKEAIEDEYEAYYLYRSMASMTTDEREKKFLTHMYEDEKSHYEMFQQLYHMLTGEYVPNPKKRPICTDFQRCVHEALEDKLEAIETYKLMLLSYPIQEAYAPIFIALHDETEHAIRLTTMRK